MLLLPLLEALFFFFCGGVGGGWILDLHFHIPMYTIYLTSVTTDHPDNYSVSVVCMLSDHQLTFEARHGVI